MFQSLKFGNQCPDCKGDGWFYVETPAGVTRIPCDTCDCSGEVKDEED